MSDIITIVDHIGRTVIGVKKKETAKSLTIFNPVIIHVQPDAESGQLQVQSFPYLFMEFIKGEKEQNNWTFDKSAIAVSDVVLDDKIILQYENINKPRPSVEQEEEPEVVKLFTGDGSDAN